MKPKGLKSNVLVLLDEGVKRSVIAERLSCSQTIVGYYVKHYRPHLQLKRVFTTNKDNRFCPKCGGFKDKYHSYCKLCVNAYQKTRTLKASVRAVAKLNNDKIRKDRRTFISSAKSVPCVDCGRSFIPFAMDFDHVRGKKLYTISQMVSKKCSIKKIKIEIAKCDVLCATCHRIRTWNRTYHNESI